MRKWLIGILIMFCIIIFTPSTHALQAPFIDNFANYDAFLVGVDDYLFEEDYYFKDYEMDLQDDYYVSYRIEHMAYNRRNFTGHGEAIITFQSKDKTKDYHFDLVIRIKSSDEIMSIETYGVNEYGIILLKGDTNYVSITLLNEQVLPESEIRRIFQNICDIYGLTMEEPL